MSSSSVETQQASAMKHSRDLDDVMSQTIDDSVVAVNDLADRRVAKLRNDTSRTRMVLEPLHGGDDSFRRQGRHNERSHGRHGRVSPRRPGLLEVPRGPGSPETSTLRL